MEHKTLIIGFVPLKGTVDKKARELRDDNYFLELLNNFDLGQVCFVEGVSWRESIDQHNPLVIIVFDEWTAKEVKSYKQDVLLYVAQSPSQIFSRKAEIEKKKDAQRQIFAEIAKILEKVKQDGEAELKALRNFAAMSYDDVYKMLVQAIIGDNEENRKKAWDLLRSNDVHSNIIWMRAQLMMEAWNHADAKGKEQFLTITMSDYTENDMVRELGNFTDSEGRVYRQYMFVYPNGQDANFIRRIPIPPKDMEKSAYEGLLRKYETPNALQMMLEVGQSKEAVESWRKSEAIKIMAVLKSWKENPKLIKQELGVLPTHPNYLNEPLLPFELELLKDELKKYNEELYNSMFK